MDSSINPDRETFRSLLRRIPYRNQATEDAPPFAVIEMGPATLAPDGSWCLTGSKPASGVRAVMVAANSSVRCDVDAPGELTIDAPVVFRVSGDTIHAGDAIGPVADSWDMQDAGSGWRAITDEELRHGVRTVLAVPDSGGRRKYYGKVTTALAAATGDRTLGYGYVQPWTHTDGAGEAMAVPPDKVFNGFDHEVPVGYWVHYEEIDPDRHLQITSAGCPGP